MVYVPGAEAYGFSLRLEDGPMRDLLKSDAVRKVVVDTAGDVQDGVVSHVKATASARDAANYIASMFFEDSFSDDYGFDFEGPYELGNRPIAVIGVPVGRGPDSTARPPLMVESQHHSLTSVRGFTVGGIGEDIR